MSTPVSTLPSSEEIIQDYRLAYQSRQASLIGRREVLSGKAKFGIFGDGKELPQLALARAFRKGDFRSGYYRDQTFMLAIGEITIQQYFAQLYAHTSLEAEPATAGRLMNSHFATRSINPGWQLERPDRPIQLGCRSLAHWLTNAAHGRVGLCLQAVPPAG